MSNGHAVALYDDEAQDSEVSAFNPDVNDEYNHDREMSHTRVIMRDAVDRQLGRPVRGSAYSHREVALRHEPEVSRTQFDKLPARVKSALADYAHVAPYANIAQRNGTNLATVLQNYHQLENLITSYPVAGVEVICNRLGIPIHEMANALTDRCNRPHAYPSVQDALGQTQIHAHIAQYAADTVNYPHFEQLRPDMIVILQANRAGSLHEAYHLALQYRGGGRGTNNQAAVRRARNASKHVGGSPAGGGGEDYGHRSDNAMSIRESIRAAVDQHRGY